MKLQSLLLFAAAALAASSAACTADTSEPSTGDETDDVSVDEANAAKVTPGNFKLYGEPHARPTAGCDVHTRLTFAAGTYSTARFEEAVSGFCELYVEPNARTYRLRLAGTDCGTRIYAGSVTKKGQKFAVKITDNRTRLCENVVAAAVIVEETVPGFPGAITTAKYSLDGQPLTGPGGITCPAPGYVNCMPGPNVRLSNLCAPENRSWVTSNCPGVSFTF